MVAWYAWITLCLRPLSKSNYIERQGFMNIGVMDMELVERFSYLLRLSI